MKRCAVKWVLACLRGMFFDLALAGAVFSPNLPGAAVPTQREIVLAAMQQRPADPWPRGTGHVVMALPGSPETLKAYHEPGGSFSPAVGSFGVSLWITDKENNIKATSDDIPMDQVKQQWLWSMPTILPGLLTDTPYYRTIWSYSGPGQWQLQLHIKTNADTKALLVIRSVGPAGGPIQSLDWNGARLLINNRWTITANPLPGPVQMSHEGNPGWTTGSYTNRQWNGRDGWGFAHFALPGTRDRQFLIRDSTIFPPTGQAFQTTRAGLELFLPDSQFAACLNAQVLHLMMGLVGQETRPGEPVNYPLSWLRDGAYSIVALAQAGRLEVARELTTKLAETDFFGGFGPEADNPGLALWAMGVVAEQVGSPLYDRLLWPHVIRKVNLIMQMRTTPWPIYKPVVGPIVPEFARHADLGLVCDPARGGLIIGKMDWQRPVLFVNAASYSGLLNGAEIADRMNDTVAAAAWRLQAGDLKRAWATAFQTAEANNDRTYTCGLWPTWVVTDRAAYVERLEARWSQMRDGEGRFRDLPKWPYFDLAEAHQWLCLGSPERVWLTLKWFWDNQSSPGLYTWGEGSGEENTFHLWEKVRGWVKPPQVTPHYWTAAQMLLLQLDMLASVNDSGPVPILTVGAGIPREWIDKPMRVRGLATRAGWVDWSWSGGIMQVSIRGRRCQVRLGAEFPQNAVVRVM